MDNQNTSNIKNCGIYTGAGGSVTAKKIKITINPSPGTSLAPRKAPFRFNTPTPTRHFKGRRKTLEDVSKYFNNLSPQPADCWERIVAIVGLGGMGKTETACKFAAEFKDTFQNVAWINAETEKSALTSFRGLANRLGVLLNEQQGSDIEIVQQVYHHIDQEDYGSVLFIFNNAIRLNTCEKEFGIIDYLPTDDLPNQRFPNVLITTQTHDWGRQIQTFQVDELSEAESIEFFCSCYQTKSTDCDDLFKNLHKLLQGYPLAMTLAASQIDYNPKKDSVNELQQQIRSYIGKLEDAKTKILNEKMNRAWPTKYNKTLANVWQLTFERLEQEDNGREALELLHFMSFLYVPLESDDVLKMLIRSSDCPHQDKDVEVRLKELFRVLDRFYTVRIFDEREDADDGLTSHLGIHRLVQLVMRQHMDSSMALQRVSFYLASDYEETESVVNEYALDEAIERSKLSQGALPYVGILACWGIPVACQLVETTQAETEAAATIWRFYNLERGITTLNENAIQVLRELIGLTKSEELFEDRRFFADITIKLLAYDCYFKYKGNEETEVSGYFELDSFDGVEELVAEFILNTSSTFDLSCKHVICRKDWQKRDNGISKVTAKLLKTFILVDTPESKLTADAIVDTWFAVFARLKNYEGDRELQPDFWVKFWKKTFKAFQLEEASQHRIAALRTCLWNRGLVTEITKAFSFISRRFPQVFAYWEPFVLRLMDVCMEGMDLGDERVQDIISAIAQMTTTIETEYNSESHPNVLREWIYWAVEMCSVWIKLLLMDSDPSSHKLIIESLYRFKFLEWIERVKYTENQYTNIRWYLIPSKYYLEHFPQFILRFSSSDIKQIKMLVNVCHGLMEQKAEGPIHFPLISIQY